MNREIHDLTPHLDPELAVSLKDLPEWSLTAESLSILRQFSAVESMPCPPGVVIDNCKVPGPPDGSDIPVRIYRPATLGESAPVLIWMHGGGFVMGSVPADDPLCLGVALAAHCIVVSVDYRLAPEHPFPAALDDCFTVLEWVAKEPAELSVRPEKIAVAGLSAGGCLAAAVALMARDRNGPSLCHQFLLIPVTDDRLNTPSSYRIRDLRVWDRETAQMSWRMYLGENHNGETSPYAAPARADDLAGLPPATVLVEDLDLLRDEAVAYANRLNDFGITTELHVYPGTFHGHFGFAPAAAISKRTVDDIFSAIQKIFTT
jgi:acetyl esterase